MILERFCKVPAEQVELLIPPELEPPVGKMVGADTVPKTVAEAMLEGIAPVPEIMYEGAAEGITDWADATATVVGRAVPVFSVNGVAMDAPLVVVDKVNIWVTVTGESVTVGRPFGVVAAAAAAVFEAGVFGIVDPAAVPAAVSEGEFVMVADTAAGSEGGSVELGDTTGVFEAAATAVDPRSTVV